MNYNRKNKKVFIWIIVLLCFLAYLTMIVPGTKRFFGGYWHFKATVDWDAYPEKLPRTASDIKYYVYEYWLLDKSGFSMTLSQEDYEKAKRELVYQYDFETSYECYMYDGVTKRYLNHVDVEEWGVDYLDEIMQEPSKEAQYYYLGYHLCPDMPSGSVYEGILCNDGNCEIVMFNYTQKYGW